MERRRYERSSVQLKAKLTIGNSNYTGFIENLSLYGAYVEIVSLNVQINLNLKTKVEMKFKIPSGEILNIHGEVRWFRFDNTISNELKSYIGMEILEPPSKYREFLKTLI